MKKGPTIIIIIFAIAFIAGLLYKFGVFKSITHVPPGKPISKTRDPIKRPVHVGIVTWGGYAGGIMANNGFEPNEDSLFYKKHGIKVHLHVIDDFVQSRSAFKAGGDKGGIDIVWATVDAYALEYPSLRELNPVTIMQFYLSRAGDTDIVNLNLIGAVTVCKTNSYFEYKYVFGL